MSPARDQAESTLNDTELIMVTSVQDRPIRRARPVRPATEDRIGWIVVLSLAAGLMAAAALVAAPFMPARENVLTGAVLLGFGLGWALVATLSVRFSGHPQRWAAA